MEYSWGQFLAFLKAAATLKREWEKEQFSLMLTATRGGEKAVKEVFDGYKE